VRRRPPYAAAVRSAAVSLALVLGTFAGATLIALAAGAADLGTALGVGQIAFAVAVVVVIVRR
jgi:hypothetical protein